jgi:hypothetical protein
VSEWCVCMCVCKPCSVSVTATCDVSIMGYHSGSLLGCRTRLKMNGSRYVNVESVSMQMWNQSLCKCGISLYANVESVSYVNVESVSMQMWNQSLT